MNGFVANFKWQLILNPHPSSLHLSSPHPPSPISTLPLHLSDLKLALTLYFQTFHLQHLDTSNLWLRTPSLKGPSMAALSIGTVTTTINFWSSPAPNSSRPIISCIGWVPLSLFLLYNSSINFS